MDSDLTYKDITPGMKSRRRHNKPYWNQELRDLWVSARDAEKAYLKFHGDNSHRNTLRSVFYDRRNTFDKALRSAERRYNATQRNHIHELRTDDPKAFWKAIGKLGPGQPATHNTESVILENGSVSSDLTQVMSKWKCDFEALYQRSILLDEDDAVFLAELEQRIRRSGCWPRCAQG